MKTGSLMDILGPCARQSGHVVCRLSALRMLWPALWLWAFVLAACTADGDTLPAASGGEGEYMVRLLIDPQAASTRAPGDEAGVSGIHQLRVYVFNAGGDRVGYYENMDLQATGQAYYVPFRLAEGGQLDFYVVANEDGVRLSDQESNLTENTSLDDLKNRAGFLVENIDRNPGDLLTGAVTETIEATPEGGNVPVVECKLSRPYSLLNIFFAKSTETCTATVTGVKLHNYSRYGYFSDRDIATDYTTDNRQDNNREEYTFLSATDEAITVNTVVPEDEQYAGDYGNESFTKPVALDRDGPSEWTTNWENIEKADFPYLEIAYTLNGAEKTANVYLPPIAKTNCKYNVKCLIIEKGGLMVQCNVMPWTDKTHDYVISDGGQFAITHTNMRPVAQDAKVYATQYSESAGASDRQFTFTLQMASPEGVRWTAHLTNPLDFELVEDDSYQSTGVGGNGQGVAIRVRPTKEYDAGVVRETELYITIGTAPNNKQRFDSEMLYSADGTSIRIRQVSATEGDAIWNSTGEEQQP